MDLQQRKCETIKGKATSQCEIKKMQEKHLNEKKCRDKRITNSECIEGRIEELELLNTELRTQEATLIEQRNILREDVSTFLNNMVLVQKKEIVKL